MFTGSFVPTIVIGLSIATFAAAQPIPDATAGIDEIVVTGARAPLSANRLGNATTVITRADIERRQARYVTDLLRGVPGFSVSHSGAIGAQTQVRVRGAEANHLLVLIDGVRANDPASGDEFRWEHLSTANVERIEIVRGPHSSVWGSDAVAGVVNVITATARRDTGFDAYLESGSNETGNAGMSGRFGSPRWSVNGGVEYLETDGSNIARVGDEADGADVATASFAARHDPSESLALDFSLRAVDAYSEFDSLDFAATGLPGDNDAASENDNLYAGFGGTLDSAGGRVKYRLFANYYESKQRNLTDGVQRSSTASDRNTVGFQTDFALGENRLSLAIEQERTKFRQRGEITFGDPNFDAAMDARSLTAEFQGLAMERLTWLLSARLDDNSDFENALTGRVSLSYRLSESTTFRGAVGTGRKNPTFTERFGFFPGQFVGNPALEPERSTSYDLGVDRTFLDGTVSLQASVFFQDLDNEIDGFVFDPITFLSTAENRAGESRRSGVEAGLNWRVADRLRIGGSYTYTDATEENAEGLEVRERRRPRHVGGLFADLHSRNERLAATLTADYGGSQRDAFFPPFPAPSEIVSLDHYWLLGLTVQFRLNRTVRLFARGTNLLDEDYEQVFGYRTLGRSGYAGVTVAFGS